VANPESVPYFIQTRGCINCSASKDMKEKHGTDYGFDHEIMAVCLIRGCQEWGYNIQGPFIDPLEIVRFVEKNPSPKLIEKAKTILQEYQDKFGAYFHQAGINIEELIRELN
jgi:hypothetical protein